MKSEKGFSLIEVMLASALMGIVGVAFLSAMGTASKAIFIADERASAESLARSEMEYVKSLKYDEESQTIAPWSYELPTTPPPWDENHSLPEGYEGYTVSVRADPLYVADNGIQKITVTVKHLDKPGVIELEGFKVQR
jgi:prepilin-type N-terminal cleavage/methylation domain-containing protein